MEQAAAFRQEVGELARILKPLDDTDWQRETQFKCWKINDILVHLHFWNEMADLALVAPSKFEARAEDAVRAVASRGLREYENLAILSRGRRLFETWYEFANEMADRWESLDPKLRVKWVGPDMSVRSSMTARQMETWAHGHEVFDVLGKTRSESDRIRNIVMLGINTFAWSFHVQGHEVPVHIPQLKLKAPSGEEWTFGEEGHGQITGSAVGFAQIVTQTRNVNDTDIVTRGDVARMWMETAQCFAGPAEAPPAAGTRYIGDPN